MLRGTVTEFDDHIGLGTVTDVEGTSYLFHVIEIADGTRSVEIGRPVSFEPLPKFGKFQAGCLQKL